MSDKCTVRLSSNSGYWQAFFYDTMGRRKARSLGAKSEISRRQALVLCERLAIELNAQPRRADVGRAPTISEWVQTFFALKPDLGVKARRAYRIAGDKFVEFAGAHTRLDRITASIAAEWVMRLSTPATVETDGKKTEKGLAPATIAHYSRHVRCLFNEAVHQGVLVANTLDDSERNPRRRRRRSWNVVRQSVGHRTRRSAGNGLHE